MTSAPEQKRIRVLLLEDNPDDAELVLHELEAAGFDCTWTRVETKEGFVAALEDPWDVILADFTMPRFTAPAALARLGESGKDIPFIIVSGSVGEAVAVQAMKAGAHDFFSKSSLSRLGAAIEREMREARVRRERHEAFAALRRAEARYRLIVQNVRDYAIVMLDREGRVESWNAGAERLTGYPEDEIVGQPVALFFPEEERDAGLPDDALRSAAANGTYAREHEQVRRDGTRFWALFTIDVIVVGGELLGYAAIVRDMSEQKQLVDGLQQAVRAREEFLSVASHELKTPLTTLMIQLEILRTLEQRTPELRIADAPVSASLKMVGRQSERLAELIENLLEVTRIASGRLQLRAEPLELGQVIEATLDRLREPIARAGCTLVMDVAPGITGAWDRPRVESIVTNLVSNAIKFGPGKPVEVRLTRDGGRARLEVRDHGIGISPEQQARIFGRWERAVSERHYGGLGLGLWIVRQFAEAHGGTIRVESAPGRGSTFAVELPIRSAEEVRGSVAARHEPSG